MLHFAWYGPVKKCTQLAPLENLIIRSFENQMDKSPPMQILGLWHMLLHCCATVSKHAMRSNVHSRRQIVMLFSKRKAHIVTLCCHARVSHFVLVVFTGLPHAKNRNDDASSSFWSILDATGTLCWCSHRHHHLNHHFVTAVQASVITCLMSRETSQMKCDGFECDDFFL